MCRSSEPPPSLGGVKEANPFMAGLRVFIEEFFMCDECRTNFLTALDTPGATAVATKNDAIEWLWRAHNDVNARLAAVRFLSRAASQRL